MIDMSNLKNIKLNILWTQIYIGTRSKMTKEEFLGRSLDSPSLIFRPVVDVVKISILQIVRATRHDVMGTKLL